MKTFRELMTALRPVADKRNISLPDGAVDPKEMSDEDLVAYRHAFKRFSRETIGEMHDGLSDAQVRECEKLHDFAMLAWDMINDEQEIRDRRQSAQRRQHEIESLRPNGGDRIVPAASNGEGWDWRDAGGSGWSRDVYSSGLPTTWTTKEREEIRVLGPRDSMATRELSGFPLGSVLRSMVLGARTDAEKRALAEGTDSAGGFTVPAPLAQYFIDRLRRQSVVVRAGARTVPMSTESLSIARVESDPQAKWKVENDTVEETSMTFGRVALEAKTLIGVIRVSRELLDDSVNVQQALENAFTQSAALEFDRACLYGSGADAEPRGVANTSGINEVVMGANGAALTNYDKLIDAVYEMQVDNAGDPTAAIWHPRTGAALAKLKDANNNPLTVPEMIARIPKLSTTGIPIDETQGSVSTASSILFGNWAEMIIGMRSDVRIEVLRERYADNFQYGFLLWMRGDMQLAHTASFTRLKGIIPAA